MRGFSYRTLTLTMDSEKTQKKDRQGETCIVCLVKYVYNMYVYNKMWVRTQRVKKVWPGFVFHCPVLQIKRVCDLECVLEEQPSCLTSRKTSQNEINA